MATALLIAKLLVNLPADLRDWVQRLPPGVFAELADRVELGELTIIELRVVLQHARARWPVIDSAQAYTHMLTARLPRR